MLTGIRQFLAPPVFEDEEKTRVARLLHTVLLTFLAVITLVTIVLLAFYGVPATFDEGFTLLSSIAMSITIGVLLILTRRGHLQITSVALLSLTWVIITFWICDTAGISSDSSTLNYTMIIVLGGLLLGGRGAIAFTLLSLLAVLGGYYLEQSGTLVVDEGPLTIMDPTLTMTPLVLTGILLRHAVNSMSQALGRARRNERAQVEANRELQEIRASLERRVTDRTRDLAHRSMQLQAAAEIGRTAASIREMDELLPQVAHLISERFGFYHTGLFLLDESGEQAVLQAASSQGGQQMLAQGHKLVVGEESTVGQVISAQQPCIALDVGEFAVQFDLPYTRSQMALPLIAGERILGALDMHSMEEAAFTTEDLVVLQVLAGQVAIAIENAHLFAEAQEALEAERRAYGEIGREAWGQLIRAQPDKGYVCDTHGTHTAGSQWHPEMVRAGQMGQAVRDGDQVYLPIKVRDQVLGVVRLRQPEDVGDLMPEDMAMLQEITDQLALALDGARLYEDTQRRAVREQMVGEITARVRETLDIETVLRTAVEQVRQALGLPEVVIRLGASVPANSAGQHSARPPRSDGQEKTA